MIASIEPYKEPSCLSSDKGVFHTIYSGAPIRRYLNKRYEPDLLANATREILGNDKVGRLICYRFGQKDRSSDCQMVLLPGWLGTIDSGYLRMAIATAYKANSDLYVLMPRDHDNTHHLNEETFSPLYIGDLLFAIKELRKKHSAKKTLICGYSLGGNMAIRLAAEMQEDVDAVLAICPMIKPAESTVLMDSVSHLIRTYFLQKWRNNLVLKHRCHPQLYPYPRIELSISSVMELSDFYVAKLNQFASLDEYFAGYSIAPELLERASAPIYIAHANNDPVIPASHVLELGDVAQVSVQEGGGHCGFLYNFGPRSWAADLLTEFGNSYASGKPFALPNGA